MIILNLEYAVQVRKSKVIGKLGISLILARSAQLDQWAQFYIVSKLILIKNLKMKKICKKKNYTFLHP